MSRVGYYDGLHRGNNILGLLETLVQKDPDHVAFTWATMDAMRAWGFDLNKHLEHESITRGEFWTAIDRVAYGLHELGLRKGDTAIVFLPMSIQLYVFMSALQRIGGVSVFLDSWARRDQLGISAQMVEPKAMISFQGAFQLTAGVPELASLPIKVSVGPTDMSLQGSYEEFMNLEGSVPIVGVEQEDSSLVTFTTGSSGTPKGANRTHRFLAAQHYGLNECIPYQNDDIDLPVFPVFSLNNLAAGVTTVIPAINLGAPKENDPIVLLGQFKATKVNCGTLSPSLFNAVSAYCIANDMTLPNIRRFVTGGAPISRDNLIDMRKVATEADIMVLYGSTEVEPMAHIEARDMINFKTRAMEDDEWVDEGVNVGHFAEGLRYRFLKISHDPIVIESGDDWANLEVPQGEVGELIVAGEYVCREYYNYPEGFKRAKIRDENGDVWHRTGDLARIGDDGYLWLVGRIHNVIERAGKYVFPVRAEIVMKKLDFTKVSAYLGVPDDELGEKAVCVIQPNDLEALEDDATKEKWEAEVTRILNKNGIPFDGLVFTDDIPLDARHHSKVEYTVLRKSLQEQGLV